MVLAVLAHRGEWLTQEYYLWRVRSAPFEALPSIVSALWTMGAADKAAPLVLERIRSFPYPDGPWSGPMEALRALGKDAFEPAMEFLDDCLRLIEDVPLVPIETGVAELVRTYIARRVMARNPVGDALHLALASHHRCDFLVTWNCSHLANANKFDHIRRVNTLLGVFVPALVTPLELLNSSC